ncbi:MAG: hypothetical protein WC915_01115 [archaeon]|jgi:DNA-binding transcriptional regulator YhcF (GntR family)
MTAKRTGNYKKLAVEKQRQIERTFVQATQFPSLTEIANHYGVSRNTVKKLLVDLVEVGRVSENNHLLKPKPIPPQIRLRLVERRTNMIKFITELSIQGKAVSVNVLQKKFGGEKSFAKEVLDAVEKQLAKTKHPVIRRTKSSQPQRKKTLR